MFILLEETIREIIQSKYFKSDNCIYSFLKVILPVTE